MAGTNKDKTEDSTDSGQVESHTRVVGVGASAGGLEALEQFFTALPAETGVAFVVVVHLSPDFKSLMPELLSRHTSMPVQSARSATVLNPDNVYIIPPRKNITVVDGKLRLREQQRSGHTINLAIDEFMLSLAQDCGERAMAVILSGSGSDGSRGVRAIKAAGGLIFVQAPKSAKFDGMPQSALATGVVDFTGSPVEIAERIAAIASRSSTRAGDDETALVWSSGMPQEDRDDDEIEEILRVLCGGSGLDLSYYKRSMVRRRVHRRMTIHSIDERALYLEKLQNDAAEVEALQREMLIGVTSFFRDMSPFESLRSTIIPELLARKHGDDPLRIWVPACSTGEEAYSIAMLIEEAKEVAGSRRDFKVFATDVDERALERAGRGRYPMSMMVDISPSRALRFFEHQGQHHSVRSALRERMVFARHNLVRDAPFSKMDLVSCRNFLIYLEPPEHEQVLASLHFSLTVGGVLLLGSAESTAPYEAEFDVLYPADKLYRKRRLAILPAMRRRNALADPVSSVRRPRSATNQESFRRVLERVSELEAKTFVILDAVGHVVDVIGDAAGVLRVPKGKPSTDIRRLVVDGLAIPLSTALQKAGQSESLAYSVQLENGERQPDSLVRLQLCDLPASRNVGKRLLLIAERHQSLVDAAQLYTAVTPSTAEVHSLEAQLRQTQEDLQASIAELQTTNEEQQATNEELVASNEELQSTNEELHSVNEELHTVNVEYQKKNSELLTLTADWNHLMQTIDVGTLYLDENLLVRRFSPAFASVVQLMEHDIGRPIQHFAHNLDEQFLDDVSRVATGDAEVERHIRTSDGTWLLLRVRPYRDGDTGRSKGVVVTFVDITSLKNSQESIRLLSAEMQDANERLLRRGDELEEVFSIVSHDVKRPVGVIDGLLHLARESLTESSSDGSREALIHVDRALSECRRMRRLLEDLRRIAIIERIDFEIRELDLQPWLDNFVAPFKMRCEERGIAFHCTCDNVRIRAPRVAIEQSLSNLIENAINYGADNPQPRIDVACSQDHGAVRISVADNGKGIAPEHHERVFEIFRRLEPDAAAGSGVGLVVVRRLVTRAGGTVRLQSAPGQGAQFVVSMPAERLGSESRTYRILLVEDDPLDAKLAQRALARMCEQRHVAVDVEWAETLTKAEDYLAKDTFDGILLDLSLPDGHGLSLVPGLSARGDAIPLVLLTGHGDGIPTEEMDRSATATFLPKDELTPESLDMALDKARDQARKRTQMKQPGFLPPSGRAG